MTKIIHLTGFLRISPVYSKINVNRGCGDGLVHSRKQPYLRDIVLLIDLPLESPTTKQFSRNYGQISSEKSQPDIKCHLKCA